MRITSTIVLSLVLLLLGTATSLAHLARLDSFLSSRLSSPDSKPLNVFVFPKKPSESSLSHHVQTRLQNLRLQLAQPMSKVPRSQRRSIVHEIRSTLAGFAQQELLQILSAKGYKVKPFWINNSIYIFGATFELIQELRARSDVEELRGDYPIAHVAPVDTYVIEGSQKPNMLEWNIAQIGAQTAWNITKGEGVTVGIIDTGVRETHEALLPTYRGNLGNGVLNHDYNWFDPKEFQNDDWWCIPGICSPRECCMDTPFDNVGHGSHTCGTATGSEQSGIGVAPGAKWIAAKGCRDGSCLNYGLTSSAEWVICPTKLDGSAPDCSKGADVVSNSWGGGSGDDWYKDYTIAWRDAGIIPVFSQGNSGPRCETIGSPGDYAEVIGVGATDSANALVDFSSRGPGSGVGFGVNKPEITAPGRNIRSASSTVGSLDNTKYSVSSGTSMSAPHVTGTVALILSVNPNLSYDEVVSILQKTANKKVGPPENGRLGSDECGGKRYDNFPSYHYGEGIVDAYQAVLSAAKLKF